MENINEKQITSISKLLSLALRHNPSSINIVLDHNGWTDVDTLIKNINKQRYSVDFETLEYVVENNNKKRFSFNDDLTKIRANQGHSIAVDLEFEAKEPPAMLYHGTAMKFLDIIEKEGIQKMSRLHVHLSETEETAYKVGSRHGKPVILKINSFEMFQKGFLFFCSENGVWLTDNVPTEFILNRPIQ